MKQLLLLSSILFFAHVLGAQPPKPGDRIRAAKIGFLTQKLQLTPQEAERFFPIYNQFQNEKQAAGKEKREKLRSANLNNFDNLSDKDATELADGFMDVRREELMIEERYHKEFKRVLPPKKVLKLYVAEREFNMEVLKKIKERRP